MTLEQLKENIDNLVREAVTDDINTTDRILEEVKKFIEATR